MAFEAARDLTAMPRWSMVNIVLTLSAATADSSPLERFGMTKIRISPGTGELAGDFFNQCIGITFVIGHFGSVTGHSAVRKVAASFFEQRVAKHLYQTFLPVLNPTPLS